MSTEIIPHPKDNSENYQRWNLLHELQTSCVSKIDQNPFAEAFQSEIVFTQSSSAKPVAVSYGAGPCVIVGGYVNNLGFVAHFSRPKEVQNGQGVLTKIF